MTKLISISINLSEDDYEGLESMANLAKVSMETMLIAILRDNEAFKRYKFQNSLKKVPVVLPGWEAPFESSGDKA